MKITELHIYPVKGAAGIAVGTVRLDELGPADDRRWMIVDAHGEFITQREHPALALLQVALTDDELVLRSGRAGEVHVPRTPAAGAAVRVRVWHDRVDAHDCGAAAAHMISTHVGVPVRLVYMPATSVRAVDPDYAAPGDRVSFADGFPMLVITQESLDALNARLSEPIPMRRFRPNVVVAGATPHAEDAWRRVRLGEVECAVVKACARCATTTVDLRTATRGKEPLRTLAGYRSWNGNVWFGQNAIQRGGGWIAVGNAVEVLERGPARPPLPAPAPPHTTGQ